MTERLGVVVIGGAGYVAGEMLRLVTQHPALELLGAASDSRAGQPIARSFPHLAPVLGEARFLERSALLGGVSDADVGVLSAAPHGVSAAAIAAAIAEAEDRGARPIVVDVSADFRFSDAGSFASIYGTAHGAPTLLPRFTCALPEHLAGAPTGRCVAHPGCFATAMLLGLLPLVRAGVVAGDVAASGVTGSTGAGRQPVATTHHPERHANLFAYKPLAHRHAPEVEDVCRRLAGEAPRVRFVPHSGPFARGIHMTLHVPLVAARTADALRDTLAGYYADRPFVRVVDGTPRLKDVVGTNYAEIGVAGAGEWAAVLVTIDNLIKGAAGGALQWLNRMAGLPETAGLTAPAVGWS